ncbi:TraB/GumN family protein [Aquimonas voraii]|uniref:Pheromone shutdown-related protein TraB n=1 Tax=Aquimonas voraii TaxID=265719 RepID=A0A1G6SCB2_9GAMM|nr:TraB/GumN family protein [Aquimonas voraii]SDD14304.1 pheromone shutdown-related protein TraB [Aquimonas voraii]
MTEARTDVVCDASHDPLAGQPILEIERDGVFYTLLGTAHVSQSSVDAVRALAAQKHFDAIAVELCEPRYQSMRNPDALAKLDLFRVIKEGKVSLVAANLALSAYQRRLAEQLGVEPGAEMLAAIDEGQRLQLPVWRVDRDVAITLKRTAASVGFWQRLSMMSGLVASLLVNEKIEEDEIEKLKEGDLLEATFGEFAKSREPLYRALIAERDQYMAAALRQEAARSPQVKHVLVVIGAGHLAGLAQHLAEDAREPGELRESLRQLPPPKNWGTWITVILAALVVGGFIYGFSQGSDVGTDMVLQWALITGSFGAVGCLFAGGHPLSILTAFAVSPVTPLHPALSSGMVSSLVEAWLRKPTVADFHRLRDDATSIRGWWRNRVSRVFINFFLTNMGTAIGFYVAGWTLYKAVSNA